jgi:prepilin-type processing-associated H-X9-DG protein
MKPRFANQRTAALTLVEVLVVIAVIFLLVFILSPGFVDNRAKTQRIGCISNLRQIGIAYTILADNNGGKYPRQVSLTNGGVMELIVTGNVVACFQVMSNQLPTPKVLLCPADTKHMAATDFANGLAGSNISYFVGLDAAPYQPQAILSGDDNLMVNGTKARSGILNLHSNDSLAWTIERHGGKGNIGLADGSVQQVTGTGLTAAAGLATNRLAIP